MDHEYYLLLIVFDPAATKLEGKFPAAQGELCLFCWSGFFGVFFFSCPLNSSSVLYYCITTHFQFFFEVVVANGNLEVRFLAIFQCGITSFAFSVFSFLICFQVFNNLLITQFIIVLAGKSGY